MCAILGTVLSMAKTEDGQKKYDQGLYREALEWFEKDFAENKTEESYVKALQSQLMLKEFENTLKKALKPPKFKDQKWSLLYKIIYLKSIEKFVNNYSGQLAQKEMPKEMSGETDPIKRTHQFWNAEMKKTSTDLSKEDKAMLELKLEDVKPFFYFKDIDIEAMPTVFDWFLEELRNNYHWSADNIVKTAAMEKGIVGKDKGRAYIRDYWRMQIFKSGKPVNDYFYFDPNPPVPNGDESYFKTQIAGMKELEAKLESPRGRGEWLLAQSKVYAGNKKNEEALELCRKAIDTYKGPSTSECLSIIGQIENRELRLKKNRFNSKKELKLAVTTRNLKEVFVKIFPVENKNLDENFENFRNSARNAFEEEELKVLLKKKPSFEKKFTIKSNELHSNFEAELAIGAMGPGLYQIVFSDSEKITPKKSFVVGAEFRISDIQLVYQLAGKFEPELSLGEVMPKLIPAHNFYVFDSETGVLLSDIPLKSQLNSDPVRADHTDKNGAFIVNDSWDFQHNRAYSKLVTLAQLKNSVSSFRNDYISKPGFQSTKMVVELDRPIFRPGQKVNIKAIALRRIPFGYRVISNTGIKVKIMNPQYQPVLEKTIHTNTQGAIQVDFDLPMSGMLGNYQVQFEIDSQELREKEINRNFSEYFNVEEYKRPDYYVEVEKAKEPWVFDKEVKIKVSSKYYYGAPVKKGKVSYTVTSSAYYPWYYDEGDGGLPTAPTTLNGNAVLDDKGEYEIHYTPKAQGSLSRRFTVTVNVFDESGRSITGHAGFTASTTEFMINSVTAKDFFKNTEKPAFTVKLEDLNGALFNGAVDFELFELAPHSAQQKADVKKEFLSMSHGYRGYGFNGKNDFQKLFEKLDAKSVNRGTWAVEKDKSDFNVGSLAEGVYKIKLAAKDSLANKIESQIFFIVADTGKKLSQYYIPEVTLLSKNEYKIGETGTVVFGSSEYTGNMVGYLLKHQLILENPIFKTTHGIKVYDFKVTESMFNGSSFTWFSVFDNEPIRGRQMITVNNDYKKLDIKFEKTLKIKPGQMAQLKVKNNSKGGELESLVTMYDQSLELYAKRDRDNLKELYANMDYSSESQVQYEYLNTFDLEWVHPDLKSMLEKFKRNTKVRYRPLLLIDSDRLRAENDFSLSLEEHSDDGSPHREKSSKRSSMGGSFASKDSAMSPAEISASSVAPGLPSPKSEPNRKEKQEESLQNADKKGEAEAKPIEIRKNFAETAVFNPFFNISKESTSLDFKAPDQLTSWKAKLLAVSSDGKIGQDEQVIISQKDFFVRVLITRYLREGDLTELTLKMDNLTHEKMSTRLALEVEGKGIDVAELFQGQSLKLTVDVPAEDSYTHVWKLKVPSVLGAVKIRGIATVGKDVDAEEKTISILPSRQRLIENTLVYLKENKNILKLNNWDKKDSTRVNELMSLQIDPQLPIMLLNSIPSLVNYPYSCSEQLINKYVPLAIVSSLYNKNPKLKDAVTEAFKKTGNRKTITLPWEEKDPRRMMELTETPWIELSKGMTSSYDLISFLDTATIDKIKTEVFRDLKTRQTSSGGFSWFPGGHEDLYITLVVLEGLSEAAMYGVEFPKDLYEKALNYVYGELPKYMKAQISELQFLIYGTYVFTSFDSKGKHLSHNKEVADVWVPFIEKHDTLLTPLGHAYMAHIYKRLGNEKKSEISLKRALDGSKKDDLIGIYWAPEERSWMWYSDTVEKHAFFLQTLIQLKPQDDRIDGLVQWLLFNRKGNEWKSTKATTKAIFSLMHYLRAKTQFTEKTNLAVEWGARKENLNIDPLSVDQKEPFRFVKTDNFKPEDGHVTIAKTGLLPVFAGMTWIYSSDAMTDASGSSVMDLKREFFRVKKDALEKMAVGDRVAVGDEIEVLLTIKSKSEISYVHLKDPRGAGFESNALLSGYRWDMISRYEEPRDSMMNFFYEHVPKGEYLMKHRFKATTPGVYKFNSATIQSMYAPEMTAYSSTFRMEVTEK